ncbi:MAG: DUF1592 domain-containing protein [Myxococcota bacterium]
MRVAPQICGFVALFYLVACEGTIGDETPPGLAVPDVQETEDPAGPRDPRDDLPGEPTFVCEASAASEHESTRKLTRAELGAAYEAAFADVDPAFEGLAKGRGQVPAWSTAFAAYAPDARSDDAIESTHSDAQVAATVDMAFAAAERFSDQSLWHAFDGTCLETSFGDEACRQRFIEALGARLYRRPLADEDLAPLQAEMARGSDHADAAERTVARMLLAPDFLFLNSPAEGPGERLLRDPHALANLLAFGLTGTAPDALLLAAARSDGLQGPALEDEVRRLIESDAGRRHLTGFFHAWLHVERLEQLTHGWDSYVGINDVDAFADDILVELDAFLAHVVWEERGDFDRLFTADVAFPPSAAVANVYGQAFAGPGVRVHAPNHPGIMTRVALLASSGQTPNIILRGVRILDRFLDAKPPPPTLDGVEDRVEAVAALDPAEVPNHELFEAVTSAPACQGCHQYINPPAYIFESYNPVGAFGAEQEVIDQGRRVATHPLPPAQTVRIVDLARDSTVVLEGEFASAAAMAAAIGESMRAKEVFVRRFFRFLHSRDPSEHDGCALYAGRQALEGGETILQALIAVASDDGVRWRRP